MTYKQDIDGFMFTMVIINLPWYESFFIWILSSQKYILIFIFMLVFQLDFLFVFTNKIDKKEYIFM